jgi:hypothetical protein
MDILLHSTKFQLSAVSWALRNLNKRSAFSELGKE